MTEQHPKIPSAEVRQREVEGLRECRRQLDQLILSLDEMILMMDAELLRQRKERMALRRRSDF